MKPEVMGTLIDTDVEVDLDLSKEFKNLQERAPPLTSGIDRSSGNIGSSVGNVLGNRLGSITDTDNYYYNNSSSSSSNNNNNNDSSSSSSKRYEIPSEPPESEKENIVRIKFRLPNQGVGARRFYTHQPLKNLFEYIIIIIVIIIIIIIIIIKIGMSQQSLILISLISSFLLNFLPRLSASMI